MIPAVGAACLFTFINKFASLNGVYKINAEMTFLGAVASGVDFGSNLYVPAGLTEADFNADYSAYTSDRVAILESVVDSSVVYYTPESIFQTVPDPTINEYYSLLVISSLGVFKNTQDIYPLLNSMKDLIQSQLGVTDPIRVVTNPQNKIYLTDAQYQAVVDARAANVAVLSPLSVQLVEKDQQIAYLSAKVAAYENLLMQQATV